MNVLILGPYGKYGYRFPTLSGGARILVTGILVALIFLRLFQ